MGQTELLDRSVETESSVRRLSKEEILEARISELYQANQKLQDLNKNLENQLKFNLPSVQRSEAAFQRLISLVPDIIFKISPEGYFTFMSPVAEQTLGFSPSEIIGQHFTEFVPKEHHNALSDFYKENIKDKKENAYCEYPIKTKDEKIIWIGQNVRLIEIDDKSFEFIAIARDITTKKTNDDSFKNTQISLSTIISNSPKGVVVEDENRKIILVNQLFCDMFDVSVKPENLVGMEYVKMVGELKHLLNDPEQFIKKIAEIYTPEKDQSDENISMIDGRILQQNCLPILVEGLFHGNLWRYTDITELHESNEQLRKSEEKYRGIINNLALGFIEVDKYQTIVSANECFCKSLGYEEEELLGKNASMLFVANEYSDIVKKQIEIRKKGQASSYEIQMTKKDRSQIWAIVSGAPIMDENGDFTGSMGIHYDITERKMLERELEHAKQVAEDARFVEQQFLLNMSHEIRTPLNAIVGMTHLLFDTLPTKQQNSYLETLKSSSDFLLSLISDLFEMAKIESGGKKAKKRPFDLVGLLQTTLQVFQIKLEGRPIKLNIQIDSQINGDYVGDDKILNQIFLNLVGNSEKFTEEGSIDIKANLKRQEGELSWIEFEISDTGCGIPEEKLELIFEKFKQINIDGHKQKGTGLGLAITKQLIELQKGTIDVKSREGKGTTFIFTLPFLKSNTEIKPSARTIQEAPNTIDGCTILVAEDNLMNQKYISSLLNKWNIKFTIASDGKKAVELALKQKFDIILMDVQMPNMDGFEATIAIRNINNPNQNVPIVALTASVIKDQESKAISVGMNDFITKPFVPNDLLETIKKHLDGSKS